MSINFITSLFQGGSKDSQDAAVSGNKNAANNETNSGETEEEFHMSEEEEYRFVIKNYISMVESPRLENNHFDLKVFDERYSKLYEKSVLVNLTTDTGEVHVQTYDETLLEMHQWVDRPDVVFKIFRYKMVSPGCLDYKMRASTDDFDLKVSGLAKYRKGRIYESEITRAFEKRVSGQVPAEKRHSALGCRVHELPSTVNGQLLGMRAGALPVEEKYEMLRIKLTYKKEHGGMSNLLFWMDDFEIHLTCTDGTAYADGAKFQCMKRALKPNKFTLLDGKNNPIALCEEKSNMVTIYGTWPLEGNSGDEGNTERMENLGHVAGVHAFFPWFVLKREKVGNEYIYFVSALSKANQESEGVGLEPLYKIETHKDKAQFNKKIYKIADPYHAKDQLGLVTSERNHQEKNLQVDVAPGVDPALILCLAVCVEEQE